MTIEDMFRNKLTELGCDVEDFSIEPVEDNDVRRETLPLAPVEGKFYEDRKVHRVTCKSTGKFRHYATGHGSAFPDDFGNDVKARVFE